MVRGPAMEPSLVSILPIALSAEARANYTDIALRAVFANWLQKPCACCKLKAFPKGALSLIRASVDQPARTAMTSSLC